MSCSSTGANTKIGYVKETTYGVIPSTPSLIDLPVASASMTLSKDEIVDARLDGTRDVKDVTFGNKTVSGDIAGDFSATDYDKFIESFMFNEFTAGSTEIGDSLISYTMEESQLDIGKYRKFTGMVANSMNVESAVEGNATISFGLLGKDESYTLGGTDADTSLDADDYTASAFNTPFRHVNGTVSDENGTLIGIVQSVSLSGDNQIDSQFVWGSDTVDCQVPKKVQITGSLSIYYIDESIVNKWIQGQSSQLTFSLTDGTNTYTFHMGKIYYTGADMGVSDDGVRVISMPFRAVNSGSSSLRITKA